MQFSQVSGFLEIPIDDNIISVLINNNFGFTGYIIVNGTNRHNGLRILPGQSLRILGKYKETLAGKITLLFDSFGGPSADSIKIGVMVKRKIN